MAKQTTADRLKTLMKERKLRQVDVIEMCRPYAARMGIKLEKNDMSAYVNGKYVPAQRKLNALAMALNVSEVWLMGYDVPRDRTDEPLDFATTNTIVAGDELSTKEAELLSIYRSLNDTGQGMLMSTARAFAGNPEMQIEEKEREEKESEIA